MRAAGLLVLVGSTGACSLPARRADFDSIDPAERTLALARAAGDPARADVRRLIALLDSDDPAERMIAINALERSTGQRLGYDHADAEASRRSAVERWVEWERTRHAAGEVAPADASPTPSAQ